MCKPIIPLFALHSSQTEKCGGTTKILNRYKKGMLRLLPSPKCIYEFLECKISLDLQYYIWWILKSKGDFVMKSFSKAFGRIVLILTVVIRSEDLSRDIRDRYPRVHGFCLCRPEIVWDKSLCCSIGIYGATNTYRRNCFCEYERYCS